MTIIYIFLVLPSCHFAYIDPGTGNMAIQILFALFTGGLYVLYRFWDSLKRLITRLSLAIKKMTRRERDAS